MRNYLIRLACALLSANALAGDPLAPLVAEALARNPELKSLEAQVAVAEGKKSQSRAWKNPQVELEAGYRNTSDEEGILQGHGYTVGVTIMQPFEFPGKTRLRQSLAAGEVEIARLGLEQFRLALAGQVRAQALRHAVADLRMQTIQEIRDRESDIIALLKQRPSTSPAQLLERRIIEAGLLDLRRQQAEAESERQEASLELAALVGKPVTPRFSLTFPDQKHDIKKAIFQAQSGNPLLKIRTAELARSGEEITAAQLAARPNFAFGPFFSQDSAGESEMNVGAAFSIEIPAWDRNIGNIEAARATQQSAQAQLADARQKMEAAITRHIRAYELRRKLLSEISEQTVAELEEAAELADRQYRLGAIPVQLYLDTQREYLNVRLLRAEVILAAWQNLLDLQLLIGKP